VGWFDLMWSVLMVATGMMMGATMHSLWVRKSKRALHATARSA
jgi:hypothetical protein